MRFSALVQSRDVACRTRSLPVIAFAVKCDDAVVVQLKMHAAAAIARAQRALQTNPALLSMNSSVVRSTR